MLQQALVYCIVSMVALGVGAGGMFWALVRLTLDNGFCLREDVTCNVCNGRVCNFAGSAVVHWTQGGYAFCSHACVERAHRANAETQALLAELREARKRYQP